MFGSSGERPFNLPERHPLARVRCLPLRGFCDLTTWTTRHYQTTGSNPMKQLFHLTILFLASLLLSSCTTTSESAQTSNGSSSPTAGRSSAKVEQVKINAAYELAESSWLTPATTKTKPLPVVNIKGAHKGMPFTKQHIEKPGNGMKSAAAPMQPPSIEIALVANAQAGTVALVDVASRSVLGAINVNPARIKSAGP